MARRDIATINLVLKPGDAVGQLKELIQNEVNGFLFPPGDSKVLSKVLLRLMENPDLRQSVGKAARASIIQNHTWDIVINQILSLGEIRQEQICKGELIQ